MNPGRPTTSLENDDAAAAAANVAAMSKGRVLADAALLVLKDEALSALVSENQSLTLEVAETRRRNKEHRRLFKLQTEFISELFRGARRPGNRRQRIGIPVALDNCYFCCHPIPRGEGGICPCGERGYCSRECQKMDWGRHHKVACATRRNGQG